MIGLDFMTFFTLEIPDFTKKIGTKNHDFEITVKSSIFHKKRLGKVAMSHKLVVFELRNENYY